MPDNDNSISATRRQPRQRRSRLLVASLREACLRILHEGAPEQLSVTRIAEVAGVTIGSFYQYYPNKEALLLDVLLEHAPGEAERIADETRHIDQLRRESLEATLAELIDVTCERHLRLLSLHGEIYRRYHRVIDFHELGRLDARARRGHRARVAGLAAVSRRPATDADELPAPGPRAALTHRQGEPRCPPIRTIPPSTGKSSRR